MSIVNILDRRRWDDRCPHCERPIDMHSKFEAADYETEFVCECPGCERKINVIVEQVPNFGLAKIESD